MRRAAPSLALLLGVFVGIYSGVFTVNEAASAAADSGAVVCCGPAPIELGQRL